MSAQTSKQDLVIASLLSGSTIAQAAAWAHLNEKTVRRWLKNDATFQAAYREARRRAFEAAVGALANLSAEAVNELRRILQNPTACDRDKLRAIHLVLSHARAASLGDLEELYEKLELALEKSGVNL